MKILEIIELRSASQQLNSLKPELLSLISKLNKETSNCSLKIYQHLSVDTDFSIHLHYDSDQADNNGSTMGLKIISILKEFGLTYHRIWIEQITNK
jgi:hypothetical protein